jgi:predicted Zn-dependent protease
MTFKLKSKIAICALLTATAFVSGCTTNPATGEQSFTAFMDAEDEIRVGAEEHPKMLEAFGGTYDNAALTKYVNEIGQRMVAKSELPDLKFQFFVLNDDTVNAFALPGGYVYLSRGLIALAEDEAELAGVIGHEIGHVTARHSAQRYSSTMATNIGLTAVSILGSVFGAPSGLGNLASFGAQAALQSYSRSQELEADKLGVRYMNQLGYDPRAVRDFFAKLHAHTEIQAKKAGRSADEFSIMQTHPRTADRITQAEELAQTQTPPNPRRGRDPFLNQVDGILFGKDPAEGFMKGDTFIHPVLGFKFDFPPGFKVNNGKTKIEATDENGTTIVFDMESPKVATGMSDLAVYISNHWGPSLNIKPEGVERITINGLAAATGSASVDTNKGPHLLRMLAIRTARDRLYRFVFLTKPDVTDKMSVPLRRTTYSFNLLKPGEADDHEPPRIRIKTVNAGETKASIAAQMPFADYNDDWFRALNLNVVTDGLATGERVKIVRN